MSTDCETLEFYQANAREYADRFSREEADEDLAAFIQAVTPGGLILDWGCGPGTWAAFMRDAGLTVDARDACAGMSEVAQDRYGVTVRQETFEALNEEGRYDGIWANFSLLHAPRANMPANLARAYRALKPGGRLHLGLKLGEGSARDHLGRLYTYYTLPELTGLVEGAGFQDIVTRIDEGAGMAGTVDAFVILAAHA